VFRSQSLQWQWSPFTIPYIDPAPQDVGVPHRAWMRRGASLAALSAPNKTAARVGEEAVWFRGGSEP
jgi:hypothetical protein